MRKANRDYDDLFKVFVRYDDFFKPVWRHCTPKELVAQWQEANLEAVAQRYQEERQTLPPAEERFRYQSLTDAQLYSLLSCLHYQCSEGNVPQSEAYAELTRIYTAFAHRLARKHPEYRWQLPEP